MIAITDFGKKNTEINNTLTYNLINYVNNFHSELKFFGVFKSYNNKFLKNNKVNINSKIENNKNNIFNNLIIESKKIDVMWYEKGVLTQKQDNMIMEKARRYGIKLATKVKNLDIKKRYSFIYIENPNIKTEDIFKVLNKISKYIVKIEEKNKVIFFSKSKVVKIILEDVKKINEEIESVFLSSILYCLDKNYEFEKIAKFSTACVMAYINNKDLKMTDIQYYKKRIKVKEILNKKHLKKIIKECIYV